MKRMLSLLAALWITSAAIAQNITVNINDPVTFKELMITGASAQPLAVYSSYAAERFATFNFGNATVGNMKNCLYSVVCEGGKIKGIYFTVRGPEGCRELQTFADTHFGKPERELSDKKNGIAEMTKYTFDIKGIKANLSIVTDKEANLTMN